MNTTTMTIRGTRLLVPLLALTGMSAAAHSLPAQTPDGTTASRPATASDPLLGDWQGTLQAGPQRIELALHVTRAEGGGYYATFDSITQGVEGIRVAAVERDGREVVFRIDVISSRFEATLGKADDGTTRALDGKWMQRGFELPLTLVAVDEIRRPERPQMPRPPFPYTSEEVRFGHDPAQSLDASFFAGEPGDELPASAVTLAGTLTLPAGEPPFPAVVTITGSGPQDRDESLFGHKPFFVIADHLTRNGIAVLRFDDRGTAASTGEFAGATSADFADDVRAAVRFLATRDEIDAGRIGLLGHSEGALVAPIVAGAGDADAARIAFAVLLAAPTVNIRDVILHQSELIAAANGVPVAERTRTRDLMRRVFAVVESVDDAGERRARIRALVEAEFDAAATEPTDATDEGDTSGAAEANGTTEAELSRTVEQMNALDEPWMRWLLAHDPAVPLSAMRCDVLAVFGSKDLQVDPEQNVPPLEKALEQALEQSDAEHRVVVLEGLNHVLQTAPTGSPSEYGTIEETISPRALELISDWIRHVTRTGGG